MRIEDKLNQLKANNQKAFNVYVPFGYPTIKASRDIVLTLFDNGVDIVELGIPFSDPLADGPIIQEATSVALGGGANVDKMFDFLAQIKEKTDNPIVIMTYFNPVFAYGVTSFFKKMKKVSCSGIMVVDLPLEESQDYLEKTRDYNLEPIFFITPTTSSSRAEKIAKISRGFIYYISVKGTTGPRDLVYPVLKKNIDQLKKITETSICVGFGIHEKKQVQEINKFADGVIIGSEIVSFIAREHKSKGFLAKLGKKVRSLKG
ncbi:MAG: tryptophan synthase subunit alpha [Candidatus Omnitrophica bacterium]|nr:tryptophan synthase subunit alpha [Candidatus Omnitrophota bacterium]